LANRLSEMVERRRRLIKYMFKKGMIVPIYLISENRLHEFEEKYQTSISKKSQIIKRFTSAQLEDLLRTSTKNVAQEVVSSLIPSKGSGLLAQLEKQSAIRGLPNLIKKPREQVSPGRAAHSNRSSATRIQTAHSQNLGEIFP